MFHQISKSSGQHRQDDVDVYSLTVQGKGLNLDIFANEYLLQNSLLSPTLENHKHPIDSCCKDFDTLIMSCHT